MGTIKKAHGVCPNCGATISGMQNDSRVVMYGSPVRTCRKCKEAYLDTRYQEYAITGIPERELSVGHDLKTMGIFAAFGAVSTIINFLDIWFTGKYFIMLAVISILGPIGIIAMLVDIIRIKTGAKGAKLEAKRLESVARLQDPNYAMLLYEAGYAVPAEYLPELKQETEQYS